MIIAMRYPGFSRENRQLFKRGNISQHLVMIQVPASVEALHVRHQKRQYDNKNGRLAHYKSEIQVTTSVTVAN